MKQHPILGQRTQMHTRVRSHTENTQHAHAHAHAHTRTHTHTHTQHLRRSAPGARRAAAAHLVEAREASSRRRRRPLRALWRLRSHPGAHPSYAWSVITACLCHQATPYYSKPADPPWCSPQLFDLSADEPPGQPGQRRSARTRHLWVNSEGKPRLGPCSGPPR